MLKEAESLEESLRGGHPYIGGKLGLVSRKAFFLSIYRAHALGFSAVGLNNIRATWGTEFLDLSAVVGGRQNLSVSRKALCISRKAFVLAAGHSF
ncbi:hypothetical protein GGTG_13478 [Gaeumannomyces tritici R3-111a-1]|uniref:Uncharacterized protein n=1 Tax=Gaeumannomyces tritici (strain R3-111a-1) TaxID=644352 RepID=J3PIZ6_GAET3|nr:hypothetical protein GGTG_13478 [Gaeumannomyces tritici R3-111a-1]EJT68972.1 hypothetical protein GGTG_13478 [Gaeumannomyces tritici R3-111a-1]